VLSRNLENEEAKARYRAVENTITMGCNARKTNKQTSKETNMRFNKVLDLFALQYALALARSFLSSPLIITTLFS
jgi:hypothetical protein